MIIANGLGEGRVVGLEDRPKGVRIGGVGCKVGGVRRLIPQVEEDAGIGTVGLRHLVPKRSGNGHGGVIGIRGVARICRLVPAIGPADHMIGNNYVHAVREGGIDFPGKAGEQLRVVHVLPLRGKMLMRTILACHSAPRVA